MKLYTARHTFQLGKLEKAMAGLKTSTATLWSVVQKKVQKYLDELSPSEGEEDDGEEEEKEKEDESTETRSSASLLGDEDTRSTHSKSSKTSTSRAARAI